MASRHEYDWLSIRRDHAKGMTLSAISKKYGVRRQTLQERKKLEGWSDTIGQMADEAAREALKQQASDIAAVVGNEIVDSLKKHGRLSQQLMTYAEQMLDEGIAGKIMPGDKQSKADVFNSVVAAVKNAVVLSREIAGLRAGQPSGDDSQSDHEFIIERTIVGESA